MKTYKYIALAALVLGFAACSQDYDFTPNQKDIVQIVSANIATEVKTRVNTLDDGTHWENNDQILLVNNSRDNKNSGIYTYNGTAWELTSGIVLYASGTNAFTAYYPAESEEEYNLPTDQSTEAGIMSADRMVATTSSVAKGTAVSLSFERQNAKITISPILATEFTGKSISNLLIAEVTPYHPEGTTAYTAIIAPSETGFTVSVTVDGQSLTAASSTKIEAGKHYTFDLKVGKNAVEIMNVSVAKWNEVKISDVESNEYISPLVDATSMTSEELKVAIAEKIKMGQYNINVILAANAGDVEEYEASEMLVALRTALAESTVPDGSINLTISGIKNIPYEGFIDMIDYFDNNDKNIGGDKLKSLTLTDVETIGEYAFSACTYLESVNMPQVVTVGECAFNEWKKGTKLTSLNLPNATTIGDWAFAYSSLLTSVNLPKVVTIGEFAFGFCDIRTLDLPEVTTVSGEAFSDNYNLVSCSAPKATTIGYYPWGNCSKFETLTLTAAGDFTLANNLFANTPTGQINLVLNKDKESQITQNVDGTATWKTTNSNGGKLEYTFKSINLVE